MRRDSVDTRPISIRDSFPATTRSIVTLLRPLNLELLTLQSQVSAAAARRDASGLSAPLTLSGEAEEVPGAAISHAGSLRLDVQQQLWTGTRRGAERAVADADISQARALYAAEELAFTARIAVLLETLTGGTTIANRLRTEAQLLDDVSRGIMTRFSVGDARYVDVLRLRTERLRVMNELARVTSETRSARVALMALTTGDAKATQELTAHLDQILAKQTDEKGDTSTVEMLPAPPEAAHALTLSVAVHTARADLDRSRALLTLGSASRRPQVAGSIGVQRFGDVGRGNADHHFGIAVAGSITLPFTARTANQRSAAADQAQVAAADMRVRDAQATAETQLTIATNQYLAARDRLTAYDLTLLRGSREERSGALHAYRAGTMTLLELLDFERALVQAETGYTHARLDAARAYAGVIAVITGSNDIVSAFSLGDTRQ